MLDEFNEHMFTIVSIVVKVMNAISFVHEFTSLLLFDLNADLIIIHHYLFHLAAISFQVEKELSLMYCIRFIY